MSLMLTNIHTIMGGQTEIWRTGKDKPSGLLDARGRPVPLSELKLKDETAHDDDKLEFEIIQTALHLGLG